ncbi:hypothetical protein [Arthrobacter russicus]|jgi:N-acetylmuramic acid 6-phosphate etherase|uniref:N-acetylmuramic acid 6-phosphate etherase n=1 Tax=Arthrobacter russicus TaxID=172040 RepID=A0ABU1JCK5_9MICC|nr:hypothetical protein [Arthrobacter russicus]MDR6269166.1 N-acetylmuramic acid 6-phosphate etherase [Arthrobacter russicus]
MAESRADATTGLEPLLEAAARRPWVDLSDPRPEEIVALLNRRPDQDCFGSWGSAERIERAASRLGSRLADQGRVFLVAAEQPGRIGMLTADATQSPVEAFAGGAGPSAAARRTGGLRDSLAGAADMLALDLNQRDAVLVLGSGQDCDYARAVRQSADRSGALAIEIPADAGGPNETAAKLLVNLIATLALACSGRSGRTATLDLHTGSAQSPSRNEHVVMAATGVDALTAALTLGSVGGSAKAAILILLTGLPAELALDMLQRRQSRLESTIDKR